MKVTIALANLHSEITFGDIQVFDYFRLENFEIIFGLSQAALTHERMGVIPIGQLSIVER